MMKSSKIYDKSQQSVHGFFVRFCGSFSVFLGQYCGFPASIRKTRVTRLTGALALPLLEVGFYRQFPPPHEAQEHEIIVHNTLKFKNETSSTCRCPYTPYIERREKKRKLTIVQSRAWKNTLERSMLIYRPYPGYDLMTVYFAVLRS